MAWSDAARKAALEARRRHAKGLATVYHGTTAERAEQIRREGFRPIRNRRNFERGAFNNAYNATYFSPRKYFAKFYAQSTAIRFGGEPAVVTLSVPKNRLHRETSTSYYAHGISAARVVKVDRWGRK